MDFELNETQKQVKKIVRDYAEERIKPLVAEYDEKEEMPLDIIKELGEMGFLGITIPEEYGGAGMSTMEYATIVEELSRVDPSIGLTIAAHNSLGMQHIFQFGNEELKKKYVVPLAEGEYLAAWGLTEPGSGSDARALRSKAEKTNDGFILNGTKTFITNPTHGGLVVVMARDDIGDPKHKISAFVVEKGTPGYSIGKKLLKMGMRASDTAELLFDNCEIPEENLIGERGMGFRQAMHILEGGRISIAAMSVGIAQGAYEIALKYAKEREAFGKTIIHHQAVGNMLADMSTEIEAARLLVQKAAAMKDADRDYNLIASQAKLYASELCVRVANDAVQILGGYGYIREYPAEKFFRDAKLATIGEGTTEVQKLVITRYLMEE
jgi:alkylation response protein AidB-like acyl-CoA dehydrogenase